MSSRGPYAKGIERRREILDAALRLIGAGGLSAATIALVAESVGMSPNGLLHHFDSKDEMLVDVLRHRDALAQADFGETRLTKALARPEPDVDDLARPLLELVRHNAEVSGLVHLFTRLAAEGTEPAHAAHDFFRERYAGFRSQTTEAIAVLQQRGAVRDDIDPAHAAALLFAAIDGLQTQWLYDPEIDMPAALSTLIDMLRPTTRLTNSTTNRTTT